MATQTTKKQLQELQKVINAGNPDKLEVFYKVADISFSASGDKVRVYQHLCDTGKCLDYTSHSDISRAKEYYSRIGLYSGPVS